MGEQAVLLREESRNERQINASREMIAAVADEGIRNELNASIAARLIELLAVPPQTRQER